MMINPDRFATSFLFKYRHLRVYYHIFQSMFYLLFSFSFFDRIFSSLFFYAQCFIFLCEIWIWLLQSQFSLKHVLVLFFESILRSLSKKKRYSEVLIYATIDSSNNSFSIPKIIKKILCTKFKSSILFQPELYHAWFLKNII